MGGREVRQVPLAFSGPNTKRETPSGLMHFYKYHNYTVEEAEVKHRTGEGGGGGGGESPPGYGPDKSLHI